MFIIFMDIDNILTKYIFCHSCFCLFLVLVFFIRSTYLILVFFFLYFKFPRACYVCSVFLKLWHIYMWNNYSINGHGHHFFAPCSRPHCDFEMKKLELDSNKSAHPLLFVCYFAVNVLVLSHEMKPHNLCFMYYTV